MKKCSVESCNSNRVSGEYCHMHYMRRWRHGDPLIVKCNHMRHGLKNHSLYMIWTGIKRRCYNKNHKQYEYYGGRGIRMYDEWKNSAKFFIEWCLENGWEEGLEIDRKNNNGDYCPENCRFVTHQKNMCNQRLLYKNNTSGYRGVSWNKHNKIYRSQITINGRTIMIGQFKNKKDAAFAYNKKAIELNDGRPINDLSGFKK